MRLYGPGTLPITTELLNAPPLLNNLAAAAHQNSVSKGFYEEGSRNFGEALMLVVSELAEALEEYRDGRTPTEVYYADGKPEGIPIELADALIRILDICGAYGVDIDKAVRLKMAHNLTRPHKHGKVC